MHTVFLSRSFSLPGEGLFVVVELLGMRSTPITGTGCVRVKGLCREAGRGLFRARIIRSSDSIPADRGLPQFSLLRHTVGLAVKILLLYSFISPDMNRRATGAHGI